MRLAKLLNRYRKKRVQWEEFFNYAPSEFTFARLGSDIVPSQFNMIMALNLIVDLVLMELSKTLQIF